jgi:hypothetical protein
MAWRAEHGLGYAVSQIVRMKDMAASNGSYGASDLGSPMSALGPQAISSVTAVP